MEISSKYICLMMLLLKLTKELVHCNVINSTLNGTTTQADNAYNSGSEPGASDMILDNSGSARNTGALPWTIDCVENCTCFKDILNLGRHFNPPIINTRMKIVNCSGRGYMAMPMRVPWNTDVFYFIDNHLRVLRKVPYLPNLIYLDLSNSSIQQMDNYPLFSHLAKLHYLSLRDNRIKAIYDRCFIGLEVLDNLDLSYNLINFIHPHAFTGLSHLNELSLQGNKLSNLSSDWFQDMFDIRELDLSQNLLTAIHAKALDSLTNLYSLKLAENKIKTLDLEAFRQLQHLHMLNLSNNQIAQVPTDQIRRIKSLGKIILNQNPISKIKMGDFSHMNITSVSISYMDNLVVIEKLAFYNLPLLVSLHAHDNPKLIYIDHYAFKNVPNLKRLYIHNDQLSAISPSILDFLPNLEEIHLYHNPLLCDCNAFWVKEVLESAKTSNYSKPYFKYADFIRCGSPLNVSGQSITDVREDIFDRVCAPTTLQLFDDNYQFELGEELQLECHAFGVPNPTIIWTLPNGTIIDPSVLRNKIPKEQDKISLIDDCILIVKHLNTKDSGTYSCKSDNGIGYDISSTRIKVTNKPVRLIPYTVHSDYISLYWNGTQHNSMISDYQLHYRELEQTDHQIQEESAKPKVTIIQLGPQYHSYTVTKLKPLTNYEFCLIYVYKEESYKVDCLNISTQPQTQTEPAIKRLVSDKFVIGVCSAIGLIIVLTCLIMLVKKFCAHKDYDHPYDSDESETINIPLDNLYQPLSVPICTSKTSLLHKHVD